MINDFCYITILAPMITRLKLKGNELLIFAIIHGFSQDGQTHFTGSISYLNQWTGLDKSTIIAVLKKLVEKEYLQKFEFERNRVRVCEYSSNYFEVLERLKNTTGVVGKSDNPMSENPTGVVGKSDTILIEDINMNKNRDIPGQSPGFLFPEMEVAQPKKEEEKAIKTLFRNSKVADMTEFLKHFTDTEFDKIDLHYYYNAVSDWSDTKNMKRTGRGWVATVRQFIRGDMEKKRLHLKVEFKNNQNRVDIPGAMEYLKGDY